MTEIIVDFSGAVDASEAESVATYRLATAGKKGSFTAKNATVLKLKSAAYDAALDEVTLTPKRAFALTKPVELTVDGQSLQDNAGQPIDGSDDGQAGSNFVTILRNPPAVTSKPAPKRAPHPNLLLARLPRRPPTVTMTPTPIPSPVPTPTPTPVPVPTPSPVPTPISFPGY